MALSRKSKVKEICANEAAYAILQKHISTLDKDDPRVAPSFGMTIQALLSFPASKCPKATREAFFAELEAANIE